MTQETINHVFEVDGIVYTHPRAKASIFDMMDSFFNAQPMFDIIDDLEVFDEYDGDVTPSGSFIWYGPPTTKGLMDD